MVIRLLDRLSQLGLKKISARLRVRVLFVGPSRRWVGEKAEGGKGEVQLGTAVLIRCLRPLHVSYAATLERGSGGRWMYRFRAGNGRLVKEEA